MLMNPDTQSGRHRIAVIGGGAAGFFAAITAAEMNPAAGVTILERSRQLLAKVRVSGGGRCNVTHACFDPESLASHYPRGRRELRGAFHRWQPEDTINWFADRGVELKTEADGRMFPVTDRSETIIEAFLSTARGAGVAIRTGCGVQAIRLREDGRFDLELTDGTALTADAVCVAAGSLKASPLADTLTALGHTIEPLAPSLFAFNVADPRLKGLAGVSVDEVRVRADLPGSSEQRGPLLVTHRGVSGPGILRLSAWEARTLQQADYRFDLMVNWLGGQDGDAVAGTFRRHRAEQGRSQVRTRAVGNLPRRLWERFVEAAGIPRDRRWAQLEKAEEAQLIGELTAGRFPVRGKTTHKEEFVTCGGVRLREVDFRRMESRIVPGLHFAGECLDIDGITGGFNFQACWTTGFLAGRAMAEGKATHPADAG